MRHDAVQLWLRTQFDVSRETLDKFDCYEALLEQWNPKINLISKSTMSDIWSRHFRDSAQVWQYFPTPARSYLDMGSGAGFPGLVVALLAQNENNDLSVGLIESDSRKCAFLRTAVHHMGLNATIHECRIVDLHDQQADVLTARALAPLNQLLEYAEKHRKVDGICLFPKGRTVHNEIEGTRHHWDFSAKIHPSLTNSDGFIVEIGAFSRV